jgi:hypothetical protein
MNSPLAVAGNDRRPTRSSHSVQRSGNHGEPHTSTEPKWECFGSGFLLDWLAGGEACKRDIQGFSVRFENLVAINACKAAVTGGADKKHAHARRE